MEIVLFIVGVIFSAFGGIVFRDELHFRKRAYEDTGYIIAIETGKGSEGSTMYAPVIRYEYQGEAQQFTARISSNMCKHEIGDPIDIYVLDSNPPEARLKSKGMLLFSGLFLAMGIACLVGFFIAFEISLFSIATAAVILLGIAINIIFMMRKHHIYSISDLKRTIAHAKAQHASDTHHKSADRNSSPKKYIRSNHELKKHTKPTPAILIFIVALISLGLCGTSVYWGLEHWEFQQRATTTHGTVIDFERSTSTSDGRTTTTYAPIIQFTPQQGSSSIKFTDNFGSSSPSEKRGDQVTVLYLPDDPSEAIMDKGWLNWFGPGLLGLIGIVLSLITLSLVSRNRKLKKKQQAAELEF